MGNSVVMSSHCWYVGNTRHFVAKNPPSLTKSVAAVIEVVSPSLFVCVDCLLLFVSGVGADC